MRKYLIPLLLLLNTSITYAEGVKLSCAPEEPICFNCPDYQPIFPIQTFENNSLGLNVEANESEILSNETYNLSGDVKVSSESLFLAADYVVVNSSKKSTAAKGNVQFQDESFLISGDTLIAERDNNDNLLATVTNANYQDYSSGTGGANGITELIEKNSSTVILKNATYSLCPSNKNDWLIDASYMKLDLEKNRGVANNATIVFYGVPIFYMPKYSWVLSGRGSGFLTPDFTKYKEPLTINPDKNNSEYRFRIPYYFNIAPDRDLILALNYMSSRRFIYEGKYRQLIAPKLTDEGKDSMYIVEAKYLPTDRVTNLKRWLLNFSEELDLNSKIHLTLNYYRVSDKNFFKDIEHTDTDLTTLESNIELSYRNEEASSKASLFTEHEQIVNNGVPAYTKALELSASKTFYPIEKLPIQIDFSSTKFAHATPIKESGIRTYGKLGISRVLAPKFPVITPSASISMTSYSLKTSPNIDRTIFGAGLKVDFTTIRKSNLFGYPVNHSIAPIIKYNYKGNKVQGDIPLFDTTDKYADIITFSDLTSGERYSGLDRITNANDVTLSLESSHRKLGAVEEDKDLLNMRIAQTYYTDDQAVSMKLNSDYETRKSYSDIAASIDLSIGKFVIGSAIQFNPDKAKIVKRENNFSYIPSSRKFVSLSYSDEGTKKRGKIYTAYPLTDSIHFFGGLDRTITAATANSVTKTETTGLAYESCCWGARLAHFKEDNSAGGYNYSTGFELILTGLGSSSSPMKGRIENTVEGYSANL